MQGNNDSWTHSPSVLALVQKAMQDRGMRQQTTPDPQYAGFCVQNNISNNYNVTYIDNRTVINVRLNCEPSEVLSQLSQLGDLAALAKQPSPQEPSQPPNGGEKSPNLIARRVNSQNSGNSQPLDSNGVGSSPKAMAGKLNSQNPQNPQPLKLNGCEKSPDSIAGEIPSIESDRPPSNIIAEARSKGFRYINHRFNGFRSIRVKVQDVARALPGYHFDDSLVTFMLHLFIDRYKQPVKLVDSLICEQIAIEAQSTVFDTLPRILQRIGIDKSRPAVLLPIRHEQHWQLGLLMPPKPGGSPQLLFMDPIGRNHGLDYSMTIARRISKSLFGDEPLAHVDLAVPRPVNATDCGPYIIYYAHEILTRFDAFSKTVNRKEAPTLSLSFWHADNPSFDPRQFVADELLGFFKA